MESNSNDIETSRLNNCPPQLQPPDQTLSRFFDRFIRLKTRYWNRGFAIVLITFIGLTIQAFQNQSLVMSLLKSHEESHNVVFIAYGMCIGFIQGGVLATVYSPYKVFGISFIISFILHIIVDVTNYSNAYLHALSFFYIGMTLAISASTFHRIYTFLIPPDKQSPCHVPIVLWTVVYTNRIQIYFEFNIAREVLNFVMIPWFVLWLIVISRDRSQSRNSGTNVLSSRRVTVWDIPWKSFCTSMPVIALVLSYICYAYYMLGRSHDYSLQNNQFLSKHTIIFLLLTFVLVELIPEITVKFSITNARKMFSCLYFVSMGMVYCLAAFPDNINFVYLIVNFIPYFSLFGFEINHLDIAPQYASVLYGILMTIHELTGYFLSCILRNIVISKRIQHVQMCIGMGLISLAIAIFHAIFASAELQPWAVDTPKKKNQRDMQEEVNLTGCVTDS